MEIILSSLKVNHGLKELLSPDLDSYWHTDDNLPHYIAISFSNLTYISSVQLYLSHNLDDSYTPEKLEMYTGLTIDTIEKVMELEVLDPEGWIPFEIEKKVFYIRIVLRHNHQEGRDSHVRRLRILGEDKKEIFYDV